jgi:hypothetical protein
VIDTLYLINFLVATNILIAQRVVDLPTSKNAHFLSQFGVQNENEETVRPWGLVLPSPC